MDLSSEAQKLLSILGVSTLFVFHSFPQTG